MAKQRGTFAYPGSKTVIRRWIYNNFPEHKLYVEPFGGAASVLVGKPRSEIEVYNDTNSDVVTFFEAVKRHGEDLAKWVENTPYSRELFDRWCESYPDWPDDIVEHAGQFLFVQNANFGGKLIGEESPSFSVNKAAGRADSGNGKIWDRKPDDIRWLKERFKQVQIEHADFQEVIERYDDPRTLFYCDPPYVDVGDVYYQNEERGFDHRRFADCLLDTEAKWVVSYDHNIPEPLQDYYTISRQKIATMSSELPEKTETLTMNFNPETTRKMRHVEQNGLEEY